MKTTPARSARAAAKPFAPAFAADGQTDPAVIAFLHDLDHPLKAAVAAARRVLLDAAPEIREGIKWNAPSFRTGEWFATFHLRARDRLQIVLHLGAKVRDVPDLEVADPTGLLKWLGKDRALVTLRDAAEVAARAADLQALVRAWIRHV